LLAVCQELGIKAFWKSDVPIRVCLRAGGVAFEMVTDILRRSEGRAPLAIDLLTWQGTQRA